MQCSVPTQLLGATRSRSGGVPADACLVVRGDVGSTRNNSSMRDVAAEQRDEPCGRGRSVHCILGWDDPRRSAHHVNPSPRLTKHFNIGLSGAGEHLEAAPPGCSATHARVGRRRCGGTPRTGRVSATIRTALSRTATAIPPTNLARRGLRSLGGPDRPDPGEDDRQHDGDLGVFVGWYQQNQAGTVARRPPTCTRHVVEVRTRRGSPVPMVDVRGAGGGPPTVVEELIRFDVQALRLLIKRRSDHLECRNSEPTTSGRSTPAPTVDGDGDLGHSAPSMATYTFVLLVPARAARATDRDRRRLHDGQGARASSARFSGFEAAD